MSTSTANTSTATTLGNVAIAAQILTLLIGWVEDVWTAVQAANSTGTDITDAQLATLASQTAADIAQLQADAATPAEPAPSGTQ